MSGPAPKAGRVRRQEPERGEIRHAVGVGWQHGRRPNAPPGLREASREAWRVWFGSWVASFWTPDDLPGLRVLVRLYDAVERGELVRAPELRQMLDAYGITPKGQQDRRWRPPVGVGERRPGGSVGGGTRPSRYEHLTVVAE